MRYSQYIHRRRKISGHLWQGRFFSTVLDEGHVYEAIRYVENNPVRAGIVPRAEEYKWSSARVHVDNTVDEITSKDFYFLKEIGNWRYYLRGKNEVLIEKIKQCSINGRPCGEELFIKELEKRLNRRLRALPHGRPRERK
jgi:putative transposase